MGTLIIEVISEVLFVSEMAPEVKEEQKRHTEKPKCTPSKYGLMVADMIIRLTNSVEFF